MIIVKPGALDALLKANFVIPGYVRIGVSAEKGEIYPEEIKNVIFYNEMGLEIKVNQADMDTRTAPHDSENSEEVKSAAPIVKASPDAIYSYSYIHQTKKILVTSDKVRNARKINKGKNDVFVVKNDHEKSSALNKNMYIPASIGNTVVYETSRTKASYTLHHQTKISYPALFTLKFSEFMAMGDYKKRIARTAGPDANANKTSVKGKDGYMHSFSIVNIEKMKSHRWWQHNRLHDVAEDWPDIVGREDTYIPFVSPVMYVDVYADTVKTEYGEYIAALNKKLYDLTGRTYTTRDIEGMINIFKEVLTHV